MRSAWVSVLTAIALGAGSVGAATPAFAAPVYEITGRWADGTPTLVASGDVLNAEWRVNVNDDAAAPSNDPVDNVTFTATVANGRIASLPDVCLIDGVTPASSISADGATLVCNLGTQNQGTAVVINVPVVVDGPTDGTVSMTGEINGQTADLPAIPIENTFGMDIRWVSANNARDHGNGYVDMPLQWTLAVSTGSDPGPSSVSYNLTYTAANGSLTDVAPSGCSPFGGTGAVGHPYSVTTRPAEQTAPFVQSCTLTKTGANTYRLTLNGIDYSRVQVPTKDSFGFALPTDQQVVASGQVSFRIFTTTGTGTNLTSNAPTYTAPTGQTATDDASNNSSSKVVAFPGSFSSQWHRGVIGTGGTTWDDTIRVSPGATTQQQAQGTIQQGETGPNASICSVIDTRYVEYVSQAKPPAWDPAGAVYQWYVGGNARVNPSSPLYDPGSFNCGIADGGWTTTEPADKSTIKAMRVTLPVAGNRGTSFGVFIRGVIKDDAPAGQDVWQFGNRMTNGVWSSNMATGGPTQMAQTPDARYPYTSPYREILRIIVATPAVAKSVDRAVVRPGVPATYTLTYSANGAGQVPPTVDDFEIVDTLPLGMTYVGGSASPEPTVSTDAEGRQVLTWSLDGVATNVQHALTYQSVADATVEPGEVLENSVTASLGLATTPADTAQVTVATSGSTDIAKTTDQWFIANPDGSGDGEGSWTVTLRSFDPLPQAFTDTIDILPYNGDGRGTNYAGSYAVTGVVAPAGATVYYTTADPASLSDDPGHGSNGAAGDVTGNSVGWSTTPVANPTAIRVIGGELAPGATFAFAVNIATDAANPGDVYVNRAQARAEHTELVMRTSEPLTMGTMYSASLKKYVQDLDGVWHDANDVVDYPLFRAGDTVRYRVVVTNTGQGTLTNVQVSDDRQPVLGAFVIDELAPSEVQSHEYEFVLADGGPDSLVNTACATADTPADSEVPPTINCDPAGLEVEGDPTHVKSLISASPIGGGQWRVVYGIDVSNVSAHPTSYDLDDTLHFTDQASIASATVTASPVGVTLADPAWDGQGNVRIASAVSLLGNDDVGYAAHHFEVTVVADVPLQLDGAGSGADDPTKCGPDGDDADRAFNNVSALTDARGVEEDQACAEIPSIDIVKGVSSGPTPNGDGTWTVVYDVVATNSGAFEGAYEMTDRMTADGDLIVVSSGVTSTPAGVTALPTWTGQGAEGSPENVIATGVMLPAGGVHTYQVEVVLGIDPAVEGEPVITSCDDPSGTGGLSNTAGIEHNDLTDEAEACVTIASIVIDKSISNGPTPNGDGSWSIGYDLIVRNVGEATGAYDLFDQLRYGEGIDIRFAQVVTGPDGLVGAGSWTGRGTPLDAPENLIAQNVSLGAAGVHVWQVFVVVELDEATIDPGAVACPPPGGNGGLANSASVNHNGIVAVDDTCAGLPLIGIDKSISAGPTPNGDGTWTITYDLVASNTGDAAGDYDLADRLRYGDGIEVASATVVTAPGGVTTNVAWTGRGADLTSAENRIVESISLDAGGVHTYQVQVVVSLDLETVTPGALACPAPGESGGLANTVQLTHNGEAREDEDCAPLPLIEITKSISGAVTPVDGQPGVYDVTYELRAANLGAGAGSYDLDDRLQPGAGIEVVGIESVTTDAPDSVGINPGYDGVNDVRVVTAQPIAGATGGTPVVHTYLVTVRYSADLAGVEIPAGDQCTDETGTVDGALNNVATVTWNGIDDSDDECIRPGKPTLDKVLVSAAAVGEGAWEVVYDLIVGNVGNEPTTYDLDDEFLFAPTVTVDTIEVAGPDGVAIDADFDGEQDTRIATGVAIVGLDDDGYAPHVYRVTVVADVPLHFDSVEADGTGAPGCTLPAGGNLLEQGLNNAATLTDETGGTQTDTDCAELPSWDITKTLDGDPVPGSGGQWTVDYVITVANDGAAAGEYTVTDRLRYGTGIRVLDATVTATPDGVTASAGWTGQGAVDAAENVIAGDVTLAAGGTHTYGVRVLAVLDTTAADNTAITCPQPGSNEPGGFANTAGVSHNDLTGTASTCAVPEWPEDTPPLASTGSTLAWGIPAAALILLIIGGSAVWINRRRELTHADSRGNQ